MSPVILVDWIRSFSRASQWDQVVRKINDDETKLSPLTANIGAGLSEGKIWIDLKFKDENDAPVHLRAMVAIPSGNDEIFLNDMDTPKTNGGIAIQFPVQVKNFKAKARLSLRFVYHEGNNRVEYRTDTTIASS